MEVSQVTLYGGLIYRWQHVGELAVSFELGGSVECRGVPPAVPGTPQLHRGPLTARQPGAQVSGQPPEDL